MMTSHDFMTEEAQAIYNVLNDEGHVQNVREQDMLEMFDIKDGDLLQADICDATTFHDVNLEAICENLTDMSLEMALDCIRNDWYGGFIDVYYITDLDVHYCVVGNR